MNNDQIQKALDLFISEFSAKHNLGDLGLVSFTQRPHNGEGRKWTSKKFDIVPVGQMSALVKSLTVQFTAWYLEYITVDVQLSYEHHGMGSNGNTESYRILAEDDILSKGDITYCGYISSQQSHFLSQQNRRILEKVKG